MGSVNVHQAKTSLSRLLVDVEKGEDIVIARAGKPVARLTKVLDDGTARALGRDAGLFCVPEDFDAPLPDEVLAAFR